MAHRVLGTARQVLSYAVATGRARANVAREIGIALKPHRGKHFGAITDPVAYGALLRAIDGYMGGPIVKGALQLGVLLFQRPTELRLAMWNEFDLDAALWTVPAERMKRNKDGKEHGAPHLVPLPRQAVDLLRDLKPLASSDGMVFPGERHGRPISDNTLRAALQTMGYGGDVQTVHGFRASARTMLAEKLDVDPLLIEAQLAHEVKDANGRSYNRTSYLQQRRDMMQRWADYLDKLRAGAEVIQLPIRAA